MGDAMGPEETSKFGNKRREIWSRVVFIGIMFVSEFLRDESRPCYGDDSVSFCNAAVDSFHDLGVRYNFVEIHRFEDSFHVRDRILGRNSLADVTSVRSGTSEVCSFTEFIRIGEGLGGVVVERATCQVVGIVDQSLDYLENVGADVGFRNMVLLLVKYDDEPGDIQG
jgi:hypothetical protein